MSDKYVSKYRKIIMFLRRSKLAEALNKGTGLLPYSEAVLNVEIPYNPDGSQAVDDDYIQTEKDKKLAALRDKYGELDAKEITWMIVKIKLETPVIEDVKSQLDKIKKDLFSI